MARRGLAGLSPRRLDRSTAADRTRIVELERELHCKEKALADATALLALRKNWRPSTGSRTTHRPTAARGPPRRGRPSGDDRLDLGGRSKRSRRGRSDRPAPEEAIPWLRRSLRPADEARQHAHSRGEGQDARSRQQSRGQGQVAAPGRRDPRRSRRVHRTGVELLSRASRGRAARAPRSGTASYTATGPTRLVSWDITYLPMVIRGQYFFLYLLLDVWSRKIGGWNVHDREDDALAAGLLSRMASNRGWRRRSEASSAWCGTRTTAVRRAVG